MPHAINKACTNCGACLPECPTGSIYQGKTQFYIDADTCADHASCVNVCPVEAIAALHKEGAELIAPEYEEDEEE